MDKLNEYTALAARPGAVATPGLIWMSIAVCAAIAVGAATVVSYILGNTLNKTPYPAAEISPEYFGILAAVAEHMIYIALCQFVASAGVFYTAIQFLKGRMWAWRVLLCCTWALLAGIAAGAYVIRGIVIDSYATLLKYAQEYGLYETYQFYRIINVTAVVFAVVLAIPLIALIRQFHKPQVKEYFL